MKNIKKSVKNFLTASALAGAGLIGLLNSSESEAHPPSIQGQRNYFSTPLYFGPHSHNHHHIYTHNHHNHSPPYPGIYIMDASLRAMFWGNLIRQQAIEEERLRVQNPNFNPIHCRIRIEEPINLPQTFIANCYQDFNRNGYVNFPEEFVGIGKTKFNADESIALGLRLPIGIRGENKKVETRLYKVLPNKDKKLVYRDEERMSYDNVWTNFRNGKIARNHGTGDYEVEFHFDGRHWNTIPFEIASDNPLRDVKVIVEPLGVFGIPSAKTPEELGISLDDQGLGIFLSKGYVDKNDNKRPDLHELTEINDSTYSTRDKILFGLYNGSSFEGTGELIVMRKGEDTPINRIRSQTIENEITDWIATPGTLVPGEYSYSINVKGKSKFHKSEKNFSYIPKEFKVVN